MDANSLQQQREARRNWLAGLEFHDAFCQLFPDMNAHAPAYTDTPETLLAEMDRCGVTRALVYHGNAASSGAAYTNPLISKAVLANPRLTGVWSILPTQTHETPDADTLFDDMKANNIGALMVFPTAHHFLVNRYTLGKVLDAASERRVPVLLHRPQVGDWKGIFDIMKEFPQLTAIVDGLGLWGSDRNIRPLLENFPNLCVGLSEYWVPEGVADLAKLYGAERLLYSSGAPGFGHGSTMLYLINNPIPCEQISLIASGNLKRLLAWK